MKKIICLLSLAAILVMVACTPSKEKQQAEIKDFEKSLFGEGLTFDEGKAQKLADLLEGYAVDFPKDSLSPIYLSKAADVYVSLNQPDKAITLLDKVIAQYPDYKQISLCYFMKGFVYDNAGDQDKARTAYTEFIQKYPSHPLAMDAEANIENLGLSPEELIKKFEAMNADSTVVDTIKK